MDKRRVKIVDVSGLFYKFAFGGATRLSCMLKVDGVLREVDTTLPAYVIKYLHRLANFGDNPLVVCFDGAGCSRSRKAYFTKNEETKVGYKGTRQIQDSRFYDGVNLTQNLLMHGGVVCLKADGYEADDLVLAAIERAKQDFPELPIDVITGDVDLVPLVDERVSVFLASKKATYAEDGVPELRGYVQITPRNYQTYVEGLSAFKKLRLPYNTVLLAKLLRGDKSDNIPAYPKFTPTKFNKLIDDLVNDGHDISNLFRYETPRGVVSYIATKQPIPEHLLESTPFEEKMLVFPEVHTLTKMCNVLSKYLTDDEINHIKFIYNGINLNTAFVDVPTSYKRKPAVVTQQVKGYSAIDLQRAVSNIRIVLPEYK